MNSFTVVFFRPKVENVARMAILDFKSTVQITTHLNPKTNISDISCDSIRSSVGKNRNFLRQLDTRLDLELFWKGTHTSSWTHRGTFWQSDDFTYAVMENKSANQRSKQPSWISNHSRKIHLFYWTFLWNIWWLIMKWFCWRNWKCEMLTTYERTDRQMTENFSPHCG